MAPGQSLTASYQLPQADVDAGGVANTATGTLPDGGQRDGGDSQRLPVPKDDSGGLGDLARTRAEVGGLLVRATLLLLAGVGAMGFARRDRSEQE